MKRKRFTYPDHACLQCGGRYSRNWVLKRHLLTQHLGIPLQSTGLFPKQNKGALSPTTTSSNQIIIMMLTMLKEKIDRIDARLNSSQSGQSQETTKDFLAAAFEKLLPLSSTQQALKASQDSWSFIQENYFFIPESMVMGLSGFVCTKCISAEPILPIKDLGVDFTAYTKHRCKLENVNTPERPRFPDTALALKQLKQFYVDGIMTLVDRWRDGTRQIFTKKINPKLDEGVSIEDYIRKNYGVPRRYYIAEPVPVDRFPWLNKLLENGRATPTREELRDFCTWCNGTYAIVPVIRATTTDYYNMILTSHSLEEIISSLEIEDFL